MKNKAWVVAVDMGYGHQRPAHSIKHLAYKNQIITANCYSGITNEDRKRWKTSNKAYNFISRFKKVPIIGSLIFNAFDKFQEIETFYPKRDLSDPSYILKQIYKLIHKGWGKHLINQLNENPIPLITTFFTVAFMAEHHGYKGSIYLITTDSDISRTWAPMQPHDTRIIYLASTHRVVERLKLYGISEKNIFFTGFPLPLENFKNTKHIQTRILHRLKNLDPKRKYIELYQQNIEKYLEAKEYPKKSDHPLTLAFAIGGAGAQKELAVEVVKGIAEYICNAMDQICQHILNENIRVILVAATHGNIKKYFIQSLKKHGMYQNLGKNIEILYEKTFDDYYKSFNKALDCIDILWTKPSELTFYAALGVPILFTPPIGSQEKFNLRWITRLGAGFEQDDIEHTKEWLIDWLNEGYFAEAALEGYIEVPRFGTKNIEKAVFGHCC